MYMNSGQSKLIVKKKKKKLTPIYVSKNDLFVKTRLCTAAKA